MGGWTLVEMSVVVSVLAVLAYIGLNALQDTSRRMAIGGALDELNSVLRVVRREARVRSVPVVVRLLRDSDYDDGRLRYEAFVDPTFVDGATPDPPEDEKDEAWLAQGTLPPEIGLHSSTETFEIPPPFKSLLESPPCSFCDGDTEVIQFVFRSDDSLALGPQPDAHPRGGSFILGRWADTDQRLEGAEPLENHLFLLLGRTGGVHRFVR